MSSKKEYDKATKASLPKYQAIFGYDDDDDDDDNDNKNKNNTKKSNENNSKNQITTHKISRQHELELEHGITGYGYQNSSEANNNNNNKSKINNNNSNSNLNFVTVPISSESTNILLGNSSSNSNNRIPTTTRKRSYLPITVGLHLIDEKCNLAENMVNIIRKGIKSFVCLHVLGCFTFFMEFTQQDAKHSMYFMAFTPIWFASIFVYLTIGYVFYLGTNIKFVPNQNQYINKDDINIRRSSNSSSNYGSTSTSKTTATTTTTTTTATRTMTNNNYQHHISHTVDVEYLLLIRKIIGFSLEMTYVVSLLLLSEIMFGFYLQSHYKFSIIHCFIPLLLLEGSILLHFVLLKSQTKYSGLFWFLITATTISILVKVMNPYVNHHVSWWMVLLPLWILDIYLGLMIFIIYVKYISSRLKLTQSQIFALLLYSMSLMTMTIAEIILCLPHLEEYLVHPSIRYPMAPYRTPGIIFTLAFLFLGIAICIIADEESERIKLSRGFWDPLPLKKTQNGWVSLVGTTEYYIFLGACDVLLDLSQGDKYTSPRSPPIMLETRLGIERKNSGQYDDFFSDNEL